MATGRHDSNQGSGLELELDLDEAFGDAPASGLREGAGADATRVARVDRAMLAEEKALAEDGHTHAPASDLGSDPRIAAMRALYASGDAEGALFVASSLQPTERDEPADRGADQEDHTSISDSGVKLASLASLTGVPKIVVSPDKLASLPLDHRCGFLVAHVDGFSSMEDILDICAMTEGEALGIMQKLVALGVISFT